MAPWRLNVGCGDRPIDGFVNVDLFAARFADVLADGERLPFSDDSFDEVVTSHVLEHIPALPDHDGRDRFFVFADEIWRVLAPAGRWVLRVPHADGPSAHDDVTHRRFFTERSLAVLWDRTRDPMYLRRPWKLVEQHTTFYKPSKLRSDLPFMDRVLRLVQLGGPDEISVVVMKVGR